ncbi:MAG TPA: PQQ-binding-like beta-propeller repeat protein [Terriglobales bacterium]|jgi:outer membrane protein assembly factor BamB|nr:PQQ-binding-like beta-propeller repeat protein [Terriglobales bacterium]
MRYPFLGRFAVLLALVPPSILMAQTSWLQVGFDAGQTYFNPYENVLNASNVKNLTVLWEMELYAAGEGNSVPVPGLTTYADIIVAGDNGADPSLSGLDETSGGYVWQNGYVNGAAAISKGVAFSSNSGQQLVAVNATNGATVWTANLTMTFYDSPLPATAADGKVVVSDGSGTFWAVDQATGKLLWNYNIQAPATYPAAAANGRAFVCADGCYAFNQSGDLLWHLGGGGNSMVASGAIVFASTTSGTFALDAATGHTIWRYTLGGSSVAAALANGILYTSGHSITALNAATGSVIWTAPVSTHFPVAVANGVLYAHADSGTLYAIDTKTGATLIRIPTDSPATGPIVVNGQVFLGTIDEFVGGAYIWALGVAP